MLAGVLVAEAALEQTPAQLIDHAADPDLPGRARQRVAADLAASALDEAAAPQHTQQFRGVGFRHPFRLADLGDGQASARALVGQPEQTAQTVFFVRIQLHFLPMRVTGITSSIPSASFAASDILSFVHGGSNTRSSFTPVIPGTAATFACTSAGSVPATGQLGAVSVMRMCACPVSSTLAS